LYPFLIVSLACLWNASSSRVLQGVTAVFFGIMAVVNFQAHANATIDARKAALIDRIDELRDEVAPNSRIFVVSDSLLFLRSDFPLDADAYDLPISNPFYAHTGDRFAEAANLIEDTWSRNG